MKVSESLSASYWPEGYLDEAILTYFLETLLKEHKHIRKTFVTGLDDVTIKRRDIKLQLFSCNSLDTTTFVVTFKR